MIFLQPLHHILVLCFLVVLSECFHLSNNIRMPRLGRLLCTDKTNDQNYETTQEQKMVALSLLDCLTCPKDEDDPEFDPIKDLRRENLLLTNDYQNLKIELRSRGLRTTGDKLEMITRLLLHIIDPNMQYNELTGLEPNLKYIDKEDLDSKKVKIVPKKQRTQDVSLPDADDVAPLRMRPKNKPTKSKKLAKTSEEPVSDQIIMDGLTRREISFTTLCLKRGMAAAEAGLAESLSQEGALLEDKGVALGAYVVGGRDVLRTWERVTSVIVLLPDELGWKHKANRILADEIAFANQAIVVVPDVFRGNCISDKEFPSSSTSTNSSTSADPVWERWREKHISSRIFDDVVACLQYCRTSYGDRCRLSLAGAGYGGGVALDIATDFDQIAKYWEQMYGLPQGLSALDKQNSKPVGSGEEEGYSSSSAGVIAGGGTGVGGVEGLFDKESLEAMRNELNSPAIQQQLDEMFNDLQMTSDSSPSQIPSLDTVEGIVRESAGDPSEQADSPVDSISNNEQFANILAQLEADLQLQPDDASSLEVTNTYLTTYGSDPDDLDETDETDETDLKSSLLVPSVADWEVQLMVESMTVNETIPSHLQQLAQGRSAFSPFIFSQQDPQPSYNVFSLTLQDLLGLQPKAVLALCPTGYDVRRVGDRLRTPTSLVFGEAAELPGSRRKDFLRLSRRLELRREAIVDYSIRVYEGRTGRFVQHPADSTDDACSQDALAIGSMWLDIYSRSLEDGIDGYGGVKSDVPAVFIPVQSLRGKTRDSILAKHLHDDPKSFL